MFVFFYIFDKQTSNDMSEEKNQRATFVERMFDRFFSAQSKDVKGFFLVVLTLYAAWITKLYVNQNETLNNKIVEEVRRQVHPAVRSEVEPLRNRVDTATQAVRDVSSNIEEFIKKNE